MSDVFKLETNDFGFSIVEEPPRPVREKRADVVRKEYQAKLEGLKDMIWPLLNNLEKDPDKDTIHWPNRGERIKEFKAKIEAYLADLP